MGLLRMQSRYHFFAKFISYRFLCIEMHRFKLLLFLNSLPWLSLKPFHIGFCRVSGLYQVLLERLACRCFARSSDRFFHSCHFWHSCCCGFCCLLWACQPVSESSRMASLLKPIQSALRCCVAKTCSQGSQMGHFYLGILVACSELRSLWICESWSFSPICCELLLSEEWASAVCRGLLLSIRGLLLSLVNEFSELQEWYHLVLRSSGRGILELSNRWLFWSKKRVLVKAQNDDFGEKKCSCPRRFTSTLLSTVVSLHTFEVLRSHQFSIF